MTTYTSFKPSVQFLEAGEKAQAFVNAANTFKPFLPQEAQQPLEGVDKVAKAFTATGQALQHFGFDEAEPEVIASEVELIPTDDSQVVDNMNPTLGDFIPDSLRPSTYVMGAGEHLQENGWNSLGEGVVAAGQTMRNFGFDEAEEDEVVGAKASSIVKGVGVGITTTGVTIAAWSAKSTPVTTILGVKGTAVGGGIAAVGGVTNFVGHCLGWAGLDEMEPDAAEGPAFKGEFSSNPQTLTPIDFNSSVVTDAYQQQDASGVDLIGGQTNQRADSYQAQENQYAVLT